MTKYEKYRPTTIEWIGDIPENWEMKNLGYIAKMVVPMRDKPKDLNGTIPWLRIEDFDGKFVSDSKSGQGVTKEIVDEMNLRVFPIGTVLCSCSCAMGKTAIVKKPLITNQTFIGIIPDQGVCSDFLYFLMKSSEQYLNSISTGAIQTYLSREDFEKLKIPLPTKDEQTSIANFLDNKTALIDSFIEKKKKLIELLKEERTGIINQAVTKGINPNTKMKPSGIDWLGDIPDHWEVKKLKYILKPVKGALKPGPFGSDLKNSDVSTDGVFKVYTQRNVIDNDFDSGEDFISEEKYSHLKVFEIFESDILVTTRGTIGRAAIFPNGKIRGILHPCLIRIQIEKQKVLGQFLIMYFNESTFFQENVLLNSNSTIIDVIYGYTLREVIIPIPPQKEQYSILLSISTGIQIIENTISKIEKEIELIQEYRTALISEVVTGKVKVE